MMTKREKTTKTIHLTGEHHTQLYNLKGAERSFDDIIGELIKFKADRELCAICHRMYTDHRDEIKSRTAGRCSFAPSGKYVGEPS